MGIDLNVIYNLLLRQIRRSHSIVAKSAVCGTIEKITNYLGFVIGIPSSGVQPIVPNGDIVMNVRTGVQHAVIGKVEVDVSCAVNKGNVLIAEDVKGIGPCLIYIID